MGCKLAVQTYTIRDFLKTPEDFATSMQKIAAIGYPAVQLSAVACMDGLTPAVSVQDARNILKANGLKCVSTHRGWPSLRDETQKEIDFHGVLKCKHTAIGGLPKEYHEKGADGYKQFLDEVAPVIEKLDAAGITFGYHNHAHEFERFGEKRQTAFEILVKGNKHLSMEVDVYWVAHGGANPAKVLEELKGRVPVIHLKDKEVVNREPGYAPVGEGNLDWPTILKAGRKAGVKWYCVEQDTCRRDAFDCLRSSFEFLKDRKM
ncbi:MAG: sugar phosphate isomerase/epimerase family protein [Planctomycetota bacterium]